LLWKDRAHQIGAEISVNSPGHTRMGVDDNLRNCK